MGYVYGMMSVEDRSKELVKYFFAEKLKKVIDDNDFDDIVVARTEDGHYIFHAIIQKDGREYLCDVCGPYGASWRHVVNVGERLFVDHVSFTDDQWIGEDLY